jgi:hypothetical protein
MHLLVAVAVILLQTFTSNPNTKEKTYRPDKHEAEHLQIASLNESAWRTYEQTPAHDSETSSDYDPRYDCLYRWYLRATIIGVFGGLIGVSILGWQTSLLRENIESASKTIVEATRSANAMEKIATTIERGNKAIMRAYLTVNIGGAAYQERGMVGQNDVKFAGHPQLANTGNTHARNVRIVKKAAIFANPTPNGFTYPDLPINDAIPYAAVAAHGAYTIATILDDFVADSEIGNIKRGDGKALHVWGVITYDDIFGDHHTTRFAQSLFWLPNGNVYGFLTPGQNDAD